ncbi:MAG: AMP-binding protein, partial [Acidobacteriota bacterium]
MNLLDLFEIQRLERPDAPALHDPATGATLTHRRLLDRVDGAAAALAGQGVTPGDRVAFYADGSPDLVVLHLAVLRLGAIAVPVNLAYREREVGHILADSEPRLVLAGSEQRTIVDAVPAADRASVEAVATVEEALESARSTPERAPAAPEGSSPALLVYTSGTTGRSKGAILTHDNLLATVTGLLAAWTWRADDVLLLALPLFHIHGLVVGLHTALAAGASTLLHRRFDAAAVVDALAGEARAGIQPTRFFGVPTMYRRLLAEIEARPGPPRFDRVRLFCSGSAPLPPETFEAFRRATGHAILERYGMSETGITLSNPYAGPRLPGTVGTPLPGVSARIVAAGAEVDPGGEGELQVRGSNVFSGYWRDPEKTAESFLADADGRRWFRTGDLAR